jgi:hypothetical protein
VKTSPTRARNGHADRVLSVYVGQELLGSVKGRDGKYTARDAKRRLIGKFRSVKKAANAISERCSGGTPADG